MSYDTLVQPFTQPERRQVEGFNLYFAVAGGDVGVTLAEVGDDGAIAAVLQEQRITKQAIKTDGSLTAIRWAAPILLDAGQRYALCVAVADTTTALHVAQVGMTTSGGNVVTAANTNIGTLLRITQAGSVVEQKGTMLRFDLLAVQYAASEEHIVIGTAEVDDATLLAVNAGANQPEATARATYTLDLIADGVVKQTHNVDAMQPVRLTVPFTGEVRVTATLRVGATGLGAVLEPGTMLVVGVLQTSGTYISPAITTNGAHELHVIYEAELPSGAGCAVHILVDGNPTWQPIPIDAAGSSSQNAAGVVQVMHKLTGINGAALRLRLTPSGSPTARPYVRNLRGVVL